MCSRLVIALSVLALLPACKPTTASNADGAPPDGAAAVVDAGVDARFDAGAPAFSWPAVTEISFDESETFAFFQEPGLTAIVDLRPRHGAMRTVAAGFAGWSSFQVYDLPMENNASYGVVATAAGGRLAVAADERHVVDLDTGAFIDTGGEVFPDFVQLLGTDTVLRKHDGTVHRFPSSLRATRGSYDLLFDSGETLLLADPLSGMTMNLDVADGGYPRATEVDWARAAHDRVGIFWSPEPGGTASALWIVDFPSGKRRARAVTNGFARKVLFTADGELAVWAEREPRRCATRVLDVKTGTVRTLTSRACPEGDSSDYDEPQLVADGACVVRRADAPVRLDLRTGRELPLVRKTHAAVDLPYFSAELAALRKDNASVDIVSPALRDEMLLAKKHGYEVAAQGSAGHVLTQRGDRYSLCTVKRGEECRPLFDATGPVVPRFSHSGRLLAVATQRGSLVFSIDGTEPRWVSDPSLALH